jgi:hypothetical protein
MSVIRNREQMGQLKDFTGLRFGNCMPTDIDGFIDFGGKLFIFIEAKYQGAELSRGQRVALERLNDACHSPPSRYSFLFLVAHSSGSDIDLSQATVTQFRFNGEWHTPNRTDLTLFNAILRARTKYGA